MLTTPTYLPSAGGVFSHSAPAGRQPAGASSFASAKTTPTTPGAPSARMTSL